MSLSAGGWGSDLSDLGGGYYLGRLALQRVLDGLDMRRPVTRLFTESILERLGLISPFQLTEWYDAIRLTPNWRSAVADLAQLACELSDNHQDHCATELLLEGAREMQLSLITALKRSAAMFADDVSVNIGISGGLLLNSSLYQHALLRVVKAANDGYVSDWPKPKALKINVPIAHPICGALCFAISGETDLPTLDVQRTLASTADAAGLKLNCRIIESLRNAN